MIWVEVLSRHRAVAARFRIDGAEARIGRGYDNDVIVDDPYVAARHLRVFRDETGQLVAEDMASANGTFLDGGKARQARIAVDGDHLIRIGQTFLRIRETGHAVERERLARPRWLSVALAAALGVAILGIDSFDLWFAQTSEVRASTYLTPMLMVIAIVVAWVGIWALLSRIFSGRSRLLSQLLVALAGLVVFGLYNELARFSAFAWNWSTASTYEYVAAWSVIAAACFFHLREISPARLWIKGALVTALLVTAIAVQTLQQSEAFSDSGRQTAVHQLLPPALRLVPLRDENAFFGDIADLKAKLDADRSEARPGQAVKSGDR